MSFSMTSGAASGLSHPSKACRRRALMGSALQSLSERKNLSDAGERVPAGRGGEGAEEEVPTLGFFARIVAFFWPTGALQRVFPKKGNWRQTFCFQQWLSGNSLLFPACLCCFSAFLRLAALPHRASSLKLQISVVFFFFHWGFDLTCM